MDIERLQTWLYHRVNVDREYVLLEPVQRNCRRERRRKMSVKVSLDQLHDRLPEVLDLVTRNAEEYVVQRDGKDWAVIVSVRQWRRLNAGKRLDALGPAYRLSPKKQGRMEELLEYKQQRTLTPTERQELQALLRECDGIMRRRAAKLDQFS